jgi:hypothetical protein
LARLHGLLRYPRSVPWPHERKRAKSNAQHGPVPIFSSVWPRETEQGHTIQSSKCRPCSIWDSTVRCSSNR